jgi:hypothetical protein
MIVLFVMIQGMDSVSQDLDISIFRLNGYLKQRQHIPVKLQSQLFLVNGQRDIQIPLYVFIFIYNSLHVSSTSHSSSGERNCINTTSGNCHSVLVAMSRAGWE